MPNFVKGWFLCSELELELELELLPSWSYARLESSSRRANGEPSESNIQAVPPMPLETLGHNQDI